jgi:hypothetical protein
VLHSAATNKLTLILRSTLRQVINSWGKFAAHCSKLSQVGDCLPQAAARFQLAEYGLQQGKGGNKWFRMDYIISIWYYPPLKSLEKTQC